MHFYMSCNKVRAGHIPVQEASADESQTPREDRGEGAVWLSRSTRPRTPDVRHSGHIVPHSLATASV